MKLLFAEPGYRCKTFLNPLFQAGPTSQYGLARNMKSIFFPGFLTRMNYLPWGGSTLPIKCLRTVLLHQWTRHNQMWLTKRRHRVIWNWNLIIKIYRENGWGKEIKDRSNQFSLEKKERRKRQYGNEEVILRLDLVGVKSHESGRMKSQIGFPARGSQGGSELQTPIMRGSNRNCRGKTYQERQEKRFRLYSWLKERKERERKRVREREESCQRHYHKAHLWVWHP